MSCSNGNSIKCHVCNDSNDFGLRFGIYRANTDATDVQCIVIILLHKSEKVPRIFVWNQSGTVLQEYHCTLQKQKPLSPFINANLCLERKLTLCAANNIVKCNDQQIELTTSRDMAFVQTQFRAAGLFQRSTKRLIQMPDTSVRFGKESMNILLFPVATSLTVPCNLSPSPLL